MYMLTIGRIYTGIAVSIVTAVRIGTIVFGMAMILGFTVITHTIMGMARITIITMGTTILGATVIGITTVMPTIITIMAVIIMVIIIAAMAMTTMAMFPITANMGDAQALVEAVL